MKNLFKIVLFSLLLSNGNCLAVEFHQIELVSISRIDSWTLVSDVWLEKNTADRAVYVVADGVSHDMPLTTVWNTWDFYLSENITPGGNTPEYLNGKTFTWTAVDNGVDPAQEISATGTVSGIREVPLSTNLTITGDPLTPTLTWANPDNNLDAFRVRLYEKLGDGSVSLIKQWDDTSDMNFTIPPGFMEFGKNYIIRVEARDYEHFDLSGDLPVSFDGQARVLNRSNAEADIPFTPSEGEAEGSALEMTAGSPVGASLTVDTPDAAFNVEFDYRFTTTDGYLDVYLIDDNMKYFQIGTRLVAPDPLSSEFIHAILQVDDETLYNQTSWQLLFEFNGPHGVGLLIDNVVFSFFNNSQMQFLLTQDGDFEDGLGSWQGIGEGTIGTRSVPEPATMVLVGFGVLGLAAFRKKGYKVEQLGSQTAGRLGNRRNGGLCLTLSGCSGRGLDG